MKLLDFLADLATDNELMSAFRNAPRAALRARGLSEQDQVLLLSGNPIALRAAVAAAAFPPSVMMEEFPKPDEPEPGGPSVAGFPSPVMLEEFPKPDEPEPGAPSVAAAFGSPVMLEEFPKPDEPEPGAPSVAALPSPVMLEEFPKPDEPDEPDEPEVSHAPAMLEEFPQPDEPEEPDEISAHEAEAHQVEPLDLDLDLAQDAVLAGRNTGWAMDEELSGVWSGKGLTVVGMGMRAGLHMTAETRLAIEKSARVLYLVSDPVSEACIRKLNPAAQSLGHLYRVGKPRIEIYETIIARILGELESHGDLCVAFYGHPGVLTYPAWESIRRARATGKRARMLPAISTEDSLFADLGIDIGRAGLQSFEATRFLYYSYNFDPAAGLLLWQVSVLGENEWNPPHTGVRPRLEVLTAYLERYYGPDHEVFLYHAPEYPTDRPLVERVALRDLPTAEFVSICTLYVPPRGRPARNEENIRALRQATVRK
jgi:Tetrapyrrole (Corrin/Porphyrin) Methylases